MIINSKLNITSIVDKAYSACSNKTTEYFHNGS